MGKKRKLLDPCNHLRVSSQDKNEECRVCGYEPMKKPHCVRNRGRFDGHYINSAARSLVVPLTSSRVFKKASYITAKCHAVGISAITAAAHNKPHRPSRTLSSRKLTNCNVIDGDEKSKPLAAKNEGPDATTPYKKNSGQNSDENGTYGTVGDTDSASLIDILQDEGEQNQIRQLPLMPLFFEVPQEEEQKCIEREWIFMKIDSVFSGRPNRGIIVHGTAGTGKTTIALYMVEHSCFGRKKNFDGKGNIIMEADVKNHKADNFRSFSRLVSHIVAYHFCQVDNRTTCLVPDFVHSMAAQLCQAPALASYRIFLEENPTFLDMLSLSNCIVNPSSAFVNGIIEPLIQLRKLKQLPSGYMILVLDSLCEAESHQPYAGDTISSFLSKHILKIPSWFKFIVTVRTNQLDRLSLLPFPKIRLDNMDENVIHDLQEYIDYRFERISKLKNTVTANSGRRLDTNILPNLKYHLRELSGGCFLFLKLTLDLIEHGHIVIKSSSFKVLPISLSEVFMLHCNLRFSTQTAFGSVAAILSTCLAALNPLNLLEIYHSVNSLRANDNLPWVEFLRIFKNVQGLLVKRLDGTYMFFHSSFRDWLSGRDGGNCKFFCDTRMGHAAIAFRLIRVETPLGPLKTLDLAHHLLKANVFKNSGIVNSTANAISAKETQAIWLLSSTPSISEAMASFSNIYNPNLKVSRLLLLAGACPDMRTSIFDNAPIIVVCAAEGNIGLISLLLEFGADINSQNDRKETALHFASQRGHLQVVEYLIRHGARVSMLNSENECPMVTATSTAQFEVVGAFLSQKWDDCADMSISKEDAILQCLVNSCSAGQFHVAEYLCRHCPMINIADRFSCETPLTAACKNGRHEIVALLFEYGANQNTSNQRGTPPLNSASREGHHSIMSALLTRGAKVNGTDEYKRTSLMASARKDDVDGAEILIRNEASLNLVDKDGMSALGWACLRGNDAVCRYLLQFPLDINQTDVLGRTPLDLAAFSGSEEISQLLLEKDADLEHADSKGIRPLDRAIGCGHIDLVHLFLKKGSKLGATTWAMAKGKPRITLSLLNKLLEDGKFLLEKGQIKDAEHRFQYALRKLPSTEYEGDMKPAFTEIETSLRLELLKCKKKLNELEEVVKIADEIIYDCPSCHEAYYEKATALISNRLTNEAITTLIIALELPRLNQDLRKKFLELKEQLEN